MGDHDDIVILEFASGIEGGVAQGNLEAGRTEDALAKIVGGKEPFVTAIHQDTRSWRPAVEHVESAVQPAGEHVQNAIAVEVGEVGNAVVSDQRAHLRLKDLAPAQQSHPPLLEDHLSGPRVIDQEAGVPPIQAIDQVQPAVLIDVESQRVNVVWPFDFGVGEIEGRPRAKDRGRG